LQIRLFARARDLAGADAVELDLPGGATVAEIRRELARVRPALSSLLALSAVAVNDEYADDASSVPANAEIALLPPVSGG
jgi:molybdopterin converting factor subunit 1